MDEWCVGDKGLLWDREWMILNERRACLSQKQEPRLVLIVPSVNIETGALTLESSIKPLLCLLFYFYFILIRSCLIATITSSSSLIH